MTSFYDLPPEERSYWYERAEQETGQSFHDLPAEERASWYERAEDPRGWYDGGEGGS